MLSTSVSSRSWLSRAAMAGVAAVSLGAATLTTTQPAEAFRGGGGHFFVPHGGGFGGHGFGGRGYYGGYGGYRGGRGYGYGYGLGGLGLGLALGTGLGYGYGGYYGAGYGYGNGYGGCLRRVWGPYGPHWVNVCY